jgi:hypothetical protein
MFSVRSDLVLDPFVGTGTTLLAAAATGRSSIGIELDRRLAETAASQIVNSVDLLRAFQENRIQKHLGFVQRRKSEGKAPGHVNRHYGFPVVTRQEAELKIDLPSAANAVAANAPEVQPEPNTPPRTASGSRIEYPEGSAAVMMHYRPYAPSHLVFD